MPKESQKQSPISINDKQHAMEIVKRNIDELQPFDKNPRTHTKEQIGKLIKLIQTNGFTNVVLINPAGKILCGHGRVEALKEMGETHAETRTIYGLTEAQEIAMVISDNRSALDASWSDEFLKAHMKALEDMNFPLDLTGFEIGEIKDILAFGVTSGGLTDPDSIPAQPANPISSPGEVWVCGNHRVICGDRGLPATLDRLMLGQSADLLFTDPPYGISFKTKGPKFKHTKIANDDLQGEKLEDWIASIFTLLQNYTKGCAMYVWGASTPEGYAVAQGLEKASWKITSQIIWRKNTFVGGMGDYRKQHEICWYGYKKDSDHGWYGGRDKGTVWDVKKLSKVELHPTQKPVELAEIALTNSSKTEDIILDPFAGSGMTLIAAETLGRHARCVELDPGHCDVMVRRWCEFTGKDAFLESTGQTFKEIKKS